MAEANQWVFGLKTLAVAPNVESIEDPGFANTTNWAGAVDWSDTISGNTTYTHSAGNGSLTQVVADLAVTVVNSVPYRITYTLSTVSGAATTTMSLKVTSGTSGIASVATDLPVVSGANTVDFTTSATANLADFVITVVSTAAGAFTMDDLTLTHGSAEAITATRLEVLDFNIRAEASNTGTITVVGAARDSVGVPINAGETAEWSAQDVMDTLDISTLFFAASVATDGFHWTYRK